MTVDIQMDTDKGDAEMRDADTDSKLNIDHLEESENGVCGAKLETQDQEHAETQANDEPVQEEPLQDCSELPVDNIAEGNVDGQPTNSDGELPGDNIAEGNVDVQPTNSDGELPGNNIAEGNVDGQPGKSEDKPDVLVNSEILDGSKSIAPDVKEDPRNTQGTQEHSSIMSESITETEQICSNSDNDGGKVAKGEIDNQEKLLFQLPVSEVPPKRKTDENIPSVKEEVVKKLLDKPHQIKAEVLLTEPKGTEKSGLLQTDASEDNLHLAEKTVIEVTKPSIGNSPVGNRHLPATPDLATQSSTIGSGSHNGRVRRSSFSEVSMTEFDDGTPEEQAAFVKELEGFYRERDVEFKPPKFYGHLLNLLKLWRAVIKLGGYDLVTGSKSWRNVGESFHPPKTCTTVSWTFRIFYEKSLLEYERYLRQTGELHLPEAAFSELASVDNEGNGQQASGSGRARRDAAARAMQGWHVQRLFGHNEDKNGTSMPKRENKVKSIEEAG